MSDLVATANRILCEPLEQETQIGNIILPDECKETQMQSEVLSVGPGDNPWGVEVGDIVIAPRYRGSDLHIGKKVLRVYDYEDILARIKK